MEELERGCDDDIFVCSTRTHDTEAVGGDNIYLRGGDVLREGMSHDGAKGLNYLSRSGFLTGMAGSLGSISVVMVLDCHERFVALDDENVDNNPIVGNYLDEDGGHCGILL